MRPLRYLVAVFLLPGFCAAKDAVDFNRDVRPILAGRCFACHGPDESKREAGLRLDVREEAIDSGAIAPGKIKASAIIDRITSHDPDERMPPPGHGEPLNKTERITLTRWIESGAKYDRHWAFVPPKRPAVPGVAKRWARNPIDRFAFSRMSSRGLSPSPSADRYALVRRVYLDLIGLPPTIEQADAFVNDAKPGAYEHLVDELLQSKQYGERWARQWLDLARYSDTNGYEKDRPRSIWPYRDWVINALNSDMPFDRFSIEQLAGDMLPNATRDQKIATGFHRNTMLNEEGGIDPLEFRFYAVVDRVATTGTVWMGLTTGCAQCHAHKYDPITHTDYYRFLALMNNADEPDLILEDAAKKQRIEQAIAKLQSQLPSKFPMDDAAGSDAKRRSRNLNASFEQWLTTQRGTATAWTTLKPTRLRSNSPKLRVQPDRSIVSTGDITKRDVFNITLPLDDLNGDVTALRLEALPDDQLPARGPGRTFYEGRKGDFFLSELSVRYKDMKVTFGGASQSYGKLSIGSGKVRADLVYDGNGSTGWSTSGKAGQAHQLVLNFEEPLKASGAIEVEMLFERHFAASLGRFRFAVTTSNEKAKASTLPVKLEQKLASESPLSPEDRQKLLQHFLSVTPKLADARKPIDKLRGRLKSDATTMVLTERPADNGRPTFRHHRGEYLSPKERVTPGVPAVFAAKRNPGNRLELARWLVSNENPLVARVTVNRAWRSFFGAGLVRTSGDFGVQSEPPSHPQLLDWLATEFVAQGWSMKKLHRLIVTSATYRQSSAIAPESLEADPTNEYLARGPRFRVDAEMVRDIMLHSCGKLSPKMLGPSVYPPQPASVTALAYGSSKWNPSTGDDRYRRSLYTFSKRTAPFAAYSVFDSPSGETCSARRGRSNTPLQALTLLNDEMFLEFARAAALKSSGVTDSDRVRNLFRRHLTRLPSDGEMRVLLDYQESQAKRFVAGELDANKVLAATGHDAKEASWVLVARAIMNLDEAITKQ